MQNKEDTFNDSYQTSIHSEWEAVLSPRCQADNASGYNGNESETAFKATKLIHGNTLEIPVYWEQVRTRGRKARLYQRGRTDYQRTPIRLRLISCGSLPGFAVQ